MKSNTFRKCTLTLKRFAQAHFRQPCVIRINGKKWRCRQTADGWNRSGSTHNVRCEMEELTQGSSGNPRPGKVCRAPARIRMGVPVGQPKNFDSTHAQVFLQQRKGKSSERLGTTPEARPASTRRFEGEHARPGC